MSRLLFLLALLPGPREQPPLSRHWAMRVEQGIDLDRLLARYRGQGRPMPIKDYVRYYQRDRRQGRDVVRALYLAIDAQHGPGIYVEPLPHIFDGGCAVVSLTFDYATRRVLTANCNGMG